MSQVYYFQCKENIGNKNPNMSFASNGETMLSDYFYKCNGKNRFIEELEAKRLLSSLSSKISKVT